MRHETRTAVAGLALLAAVFPAAAQDAAPSSPLLTRPGWEIGGQISKYRYEEPDFMNLDGLRVGVVGAYTFTNDNRVYNRIDGRVSYGKLDYFSAPTGRVPDIPDWTAEVRGVIGKDIPVSDGLVFSPYIGFGFRYLYNDLRGYTTVGNVTYAGYRRYSTYVYVPIGVTTRMRMGRQWVFAPTVEYDAFIGGRQYSKLSDTGIGFSDASNDQDRGRGYRVYFMLENEKWAIGPWLHYWKIKDSDIVPIGGGFRVLEPENWTREYGLEVRYRF